MRPDWNTYFMDIARSISNRSTCLRTQYGAIIVKDNIIISTGYNGAACGVLDCLSYGRCLREELAIPSRERYELCKSVHAEANAIIRASYNDLRGSSIYIYGSKEGLLVRATPCLMCERMILNAGIEIVYYNTGVDGSINSLDILTREMMVRNQDKR